MPREIPVYRAEREAGLEHAVRSSASVAYISPLEVVDALPGVDPERLRALAIAAAGDQPADDFDLFRMRDILVSTAWNRNDDVFIKEEVWPARFTSVDKPLNFQHDQDDILGHIVSAQAVGEDMAPLGDDLALDDVPDRFHVVNGSVIYRHIGSKERQAFVEQTIAEIQAGEWFVSMEVFLRAFDYMVEDPEGNRRLVARAADTAWMTKYLKAYPPTRAKPASDKYCGTGKFVDQSTGAEYRVGRVVRDLLFCGKGLVKRPGNPDSIILSAEVAPTPTARDEATSVAAEALAPTPAQSPTTEPIPAAAPPPVYVQPNVPAATASPTESAMSEMNLQADEVRRELAEAREANRKLAEDLAAAQTANHEKAVASLRDELAAKATEATDLAGTVKALETTVTKLTERAEAAEAELKTAKDELKTVADAARKSTRIAQATKLGATDAEAEQAYADTEALSDAAFASLIIKLAAGFEKAVASKERTPAPAAPEAAVDNATPEPEPALAAAATAETSEDRIAAYASMFEEHVFSPRADRRVLARS